MPASETRLATLRLLGATPATVSALAVLESLVLALVGAVIGVAVYLTAVPLVGMIHFRDRPLAKHGPELQRILNAMRSTPLEGRYILVCTRPFREWKLARHGGRKRPIEILHDHVKTRPASREPA